MKNPGIVFMGMGFEAVAVIVGSVFIGQAIDKQMGWSGIGTAGMILLSLLAWFIHLFVLIKKYMRDTSEKEKRERPK